jgi:hypothetical protein
VWALLQLQQGIALLDDLHNPHAHYCNNSTQRQSHSGRTHCGLTAQMQVQGIKQHVYIDSRHSTPSCRLPPT